jgi:hypothetical protein
MRVERKPPHNPQPRAIEHQSARTMTAIAKYRLPSPKDSYYFPTYIRANLAGECRTTSLWRLCGSGDDG